MTHASAREIVLYVPIFFWSSPKKKILPIENEPNIAEYQKFSYRPYLQYSEFKRYFNKKLRRINLIKSGRALSGQKKIHRMEDVEEGGGGTTVTSLQP